MCIHVDCLIYLSIVSTMKPNNLADLYPHEDCIPLALPLLNLYFSSIALMAVDHGPIMSQNQEKIASPVAPQGGSTDLQ